ncbi:hypothetical protein [Limnofasciculus baicalensis]|uniref:Uncharacterized protein n=1 Tax=Limnofasciculus baicalensis BBK-W-15 TaxID=2699891 RepID=A0AAE3GXE6_9CYAN|nr:hypothetical protein [Limnofasciculus baicalensis]MCP2731633.1 hypothetical protein [Limnofasciculus baicalensis BBK-W-15]
MADNKPGISVGGNVGGSIVTGNVKGNVSSVVNQLPTSPNPDKSEIKEILEKLKQAIESEPTLNEKEKAQAQKQVEALTKVAKSGNDPDNNEKAENAVTMLKGIFSGLQSGANLLVAWDKVLPMLSKLFGI